MNMRNQMNRENEIRKKLKEISVEQAQELHMQRMKCPCPSLGSLDKMYMMCQISIWRVKLKLALRTRSW